MPAPEIERLISDYCLGWHHPDPAERRRLITTTLEPDCLYLDPTVRVEGSAALLAHIDAVLTKRPGFSLRRTGPADIHHNVLRFGWIAFRDGAPAGPESVDFVTLSPSGRFAGIVGFFGPLPGEIT